MKNYHVVLPNQLFENIDPIAKDSKIYLIEEFLFFKELKFHKQKLLLHRVTMKKYEHFLKRKGFIVEYIDSQNKRSDIRQLIKEIVEKGFDQLTLFDPSDNWIEERIASQLQNSGLKITYLASPMWINSRNELSDFFSSTKKKFFQTQFYIQERKRLNILLDENGNPIGGQWSFDADNRKKYPKNKVPPIFPTLSSDVCLEEAKAYVNQNFADNPGVIESANLFATDFETAKNWLNIFLEERFVDFGSYEDAIVVSESTLNHSVLSPILNCGLLTPKAVITETLTYTEKNRVPLNSVEGFVRQIIGWREFIRGVYLVKGREERTTNYWNFKRKIPSSFYQGTTGIEPVDIAIRKLLETGYNHHIERLMILGNFMLLCEFDPDEVYKWFMEMYIDAYDWVMVPNVYGMTQFADGGLMSTKPYLSGSNYIMKMSDHKKGDWQKSWDGLYWRFIYKQRSFFESNPRLSMMVRIWDKMPEEKKSGHLSNAELFLNQLSE
jgi:deoxyribodipyrimidine photolyase-related protein